MFRFEPFSQTHLALLRSWLDSDHIKDFWQETADDEKLKYKYLVDLPRRSVWPFVILRENEPIGFIQYYEAAKVGEGWWENEDPGTFGIDLMIGRPELVGKNLGATIIREFIAFVQQREPSAKSIIIDPDPKNTRAVRAFAKAGFHSEGEIITPGGKVLLMRLPL
jgi:RimJ/RimL family protein N-acetyltransferase